jgi:hypothetical protein
VLLVLVPRDIFQQQFAADFDQTFFFLLLQHQFVAATALAGSPTAADTMTQHGDGQHLDSGVKSGPNAGLGTGLFLPYFKVGLSQSPTKLPPLSQRTTPLPSSLSPGR